MLIPLVLALLGGGLYFYLERTPAEGPEEPVLTAEARQYTRNLQLSEVDMKATDNALGNTLVEIVGRITNAGDRPVRLVELNCVFYDPYGAVILRERVPIVRAKEGVLNPGESRRFRLPFDTIPTTWNQTLPQLVIAQIVFG
ncbi:MAG: FxLYD domain-containing protein [Bryobacteraceae bacterium]|nr:FxLYD domain-containing protein [Bryobacteraceae bacterium]